MLLSSPRSAVFLDQDKEIYHQEPRRPAAIQLPNRWLGLIFVVAIVHGLLYAFLIPPWQAPDEIAHFEYSRLLADHWRPLSKADASPALEREIIASLYRYQAWELIGLPTPEEQPAGLNKVPFFLTSRTLDRFSLAYVPYALAVWPLLTRDIITQLYIMRCVSVLLGAMVVVLAFQTAQLIEPQSSELAIGTALFLIFLPQHTFILASVSDGNLAEFLASIVIYLLLKMLRGGFTWLSALLSLILTFLAVLAKPTAYFLIPLIVISLPSLRYRKNDLAKIQGWQIRGLIVLLGAAVLLTAWGMTQASFIRRFERVLNVWNRLDHFIAVVNSQGHFSLPYAVWGAFQSFWLNFGWMTLTLPETGYYALLVFSILAVVGLVAYFRTRPDRSDQTLFFVLGLAAGLPIVIIFAGFFVSTYGLYVYQGRYLFGGIVPLALILVTGWLSLAPRRYAPWALWALTAGLLLLDVVSFGLIISFYYT